MTLTQSILYDTDFVRWAEQTTNLLQQRRFDELDLENLIEEIASLGRSEKHALESQLTRVIMHLLKWQFQPEHRTNSWRGSIAEGRIQIRKLLKASPSLKVYLSNIFDDCYDDAIVQAQAEIGLLKTTFPLNCPYTEIQVLDTDFLP
jgi:hypothetical protein